MSKQLTHDVLRRVSETLAVARSGLADMRSGPMKRLVGLRNLVVFGRAVTNVLQNLRSIVIEPYYVDLPTDIGTAGLFFVNAPGRRESGDVIDSDVLRLSSEYLERLEAIVEMHVRGSAVAPPPSNQSQRTATYTGLIPARKSRSATPSRSRAL